MYYYERLELHHIGQRTEWRNDGPVIVQCEPERWFGCGLFKSANPLPDGYGGSERVRYVPVPRERINGPLWHWIEPTAHLIK